MKTSRWLMILGAVMVVLLALSILVLRPGEHENARAYAEIWSRGKCIHRLDLSVDRVVTVDADGRTNVVTVRDGAIAVTSADCPDHYCMQRGFCEGGLPIICLPNKLEIRFVGQQEVDGAAG